MKTAFGSPDQAGHQIPIHTTELYKAALCPTETGSPHKSPLCSAPIQSVLGAVEWSLQVSVEITVRADGPAVASTALAEDQGFVVAHNCPPRQLQAI